MPIRFVSAAVMLGSGMHAGAQSFQYERVLSEGDDVNLTAPVIDFYDQGEFNAFFHPSINNSGEISFGSLVTLSSSNYGQPSSRHALSQLLVPGTATLIAANAAPAHGPNYPDSGLYAFGQFGPSSSIADTTQVAFEAQDNSGDWRLWRANSPDNIVQLVRDDEWLPGIDKSIDHFDSFGGYGRIQTKTGYIGIAGYYGLFSSTQDIGVWSIDPTGVPRLVVHGSEQHLYSIRPTIDAVGDVHFVAKYNVAGIGSGDDVLYSWHWSDVTGTGELTELAQARSPFGANSGPDPDHRWRFLGNMNTNDNGELVFYGAVQHRSTNEIRPALWRTNGPGDFEPVAFVGDPVAGLSPTSAIEQLSNSLAQIDNNREIVFTALVDGKVTLITSEPGGGLRAIVQTGDSLPGIGDGVTVFGISIPSVNARGHLLIALSTLDDSGTERQVYAFSDRNSLIPVIHWGMEIELTDGSMLTVGPLYIATAVGFNDNDEIAFSSGSVFSTPGSGGIFVASLPDPDGDGVLDAEDNCPAISNADQRDYDADGAGDACDDDDDNDSVDDADDAFPFDATESGDNDLDGIGDNADQDDDNDGQSDADELVCGSDPLHSVSRSPDWDGDGLPDCVDSDDDNDLVTDTADVCPGTAIPEAAPTSAHGFNKNRWALHDSSGEFIQAPPQAGSVFSISTAITRGCSCEQIVAAAGLGHPHLERGCTTGALLDWINN